MQMTIRCRCTASFTVSTSFLDSGLTPLRVDCDISHTVSLREARQHDRCTWRLDVQLLHILAACSTVSQFTTFSHPVRTRRSCGLSEHRCPSNQDGRTQRRTFFTSFTLCQDGPNGLLTHLPFGPREPEGHVAYQHIGATVASITCGPQERAPGIPSAGST